MDERFRKLVQYERVSKKAYDLAKRELRAARSSCQHEWIEAKYNPVVREEYTIPGDALGTMGEDHRGTWHVHRSEKPRWSRTCAICGKVEYTERSDEQITRTPRF